MTDPRSFGAWLRRERERRSITLRLIADRTKIGPGLLEGLERGDISRWPGGIYRRAFVRAYADAVGLDADLVVANFERVFPADASTASQPASVTVASGEQPEMRLALATPAAAVSASSLKTAGRDLGWVLGSALVGYVAVGWIAFWCVAAVVSLGFHLARVLGLHNRAIWKSLAERHPSPEVSALAEVVRFSDKARTTSRRARARRMLADLSAAASSAALPGRRRAARS